MVTPKTIIVLKVIQNKIQNNFGSRENMPKWLVIYHLDVTLKQLKLYKIKFKITLEPM